MSDSPRSWHLDPGALGRCEAGLPSPAEASHLAHCLQCRQALAARDPLAMFRLLAVLPPPYDPPPFPVLEWPGPAPRWVFWKGALAAAAAILAVVALWFATRPGTPPPAAPVVLAHSKTLPPVVSRVEAPGAQVLTLVPPGGEGPSVTLVVGTEIDL